MSGNGLRQSKHCNFGHRGEVCGAVGDSLLRNSAPWWWYWLRSDGSGQVLIMVEEAVEVLDPGVVKFSGLLYQQQVCPGHVFRLFADVVYNDTFILAKDIYCQVVLTLNLGYLRDRRGGIYTSKSRPSSVGYLVNLWGFLSTGNGAERRAYRRQLSSLFFTLTTAFLLFTHAGRSM